MAVTTVNALDARRSDIHVSSHGPDDLAHRHPWVTSLADSSHRANPARPSPS